MIKTTYYSKVVFWVLAALFLFLMLNSREYNKGDALRHDMTAYYAYLPAVFIEHDWKLNSEKTRQNSFYAWHVDMPGKGRVIRMSMGIAYLHLPFFALGHITAPLLGFEANGFTTPYFFFICLGSVFYCMLGLWLLRRLLLNYYTDKITAFVLVLVSLGTNLYYYTLSEGPMSHAYNFFLITALLCLTVNWHQRPTIGNTVLAGLTIGIMVLARPLNIVVLIVPALYNIYSKQTLINKFQLIKKHFFYILLMGLVAFLPWVPQLLYWKALSGNYFFYTYRDEGFFFTNPHIFEGLFSYRKGWLLYTPIMAISLVGLIFMWKHARPWTIGLVCMLPLFLWGVFSWWCWWYGGGFGSRPMIDIYGVLALPLAALFTQALKKRWMGATFFTLAAFFLYLNLFQTWQYKKTLIHWDSMTKRAYWKVFLKKKYPENNSELIQNPDYDKAKKGEDEY